MLSRMQFQFQAVHLDHGHDLLDEVPGSRYLTMLVYLSETEGGGETVFPRLGIEVSPKPGHAILWPNIIDKEPLGIELDERSLHESKPVVKGVKYAMNVWARMYAMAEGHDLENINELRRLCSDKKNNLGPRMGEL